MQVRTALLVPLLALAAACTPRRPPPAPRPTIFIPAAPLDDAAARAERARTAWEEGVAFGRQSRWAEAAEAHRRAAELHPEEVRYHMALSEALLQGGREWEAADALHAGIRAEEALPAPNHRVLAVDYERLIRLLTRLNRFDEARTARARQEHHRRLRDAAPRR